MRDGGIVPDLDDQRSAIPKNTAGDTAALLASSRELIAEARRILAEAPTAHAGSRVEPVLYRSLPDDPGFLTRPIGEPTHGLSRRLLALVPAAAGVALLGAGLAALTGSHTDHALTVELQRPSGGAGTTQPPLTSPPTSTPAAVSEPEAPASLSVPRLRTHAAVAGEVHVQTTGPETGLLDAPTDYHQLGWYRHGDTGALVLDGHVGYRNDPGPLAFIGSLAAGDVIVVSFPSGDRAFAVSVVGRAVKGALPQQYFSDQYDQDLMLITCDYTSPFRAGHFADNVYVVASPNP